MEKLTRLLRKPTIILTLHKVFKGIIIVLFGNALAFYQLLHYVIHKVTSFWTHGNLSNYVAQL